MKIRAIVVDDEFESREGMRMLLEDIPEIELVQVCKNGLEAIEVIKLGTIDLMFLDIQMPLVSGFDVIRSVPKESLPWIIFVTAHDEYTLKAFELHAVDYILKPFTDERFKHALSRASDLISMKKDREHFIELSKEEGIKESSIVSSPMKDRAVIKVNGKVLFIPHEQLTWIEAYDYYIKIHQMDKTHIVRSSMKQMESELPSDHFLRIHKSTIVNISHIVSIDSIGGEMSVILSDNTRRNVSRSYRDQVKDLK